MCVVRMRISLRRPHPIDRSNHSTYNREDTDPQRTTTHRYRISAFVPMNAPPAAAVGAAASAEAPGEGSGGGWEAGGGEKAADNGGGGGHGGGFKSRKRERG